MQARGRVTCIGDARALDAEDPDVADVSERYFRYFPSARQYEQTHSFQFFRLDLVRVRFIGGFGQIFWVQPGEFLAANPFAAAQESRIIQHMNDDNRDALMHYTGGKTAVMVGIDAEGFDVVQSGNRVRFDFDAPISTTEEARQALIAMLKRPA